MYKTPTFRVYTLAGLQAFQHTELILYPMMKLWIGILCMCRCCHSVHLFHLLLSSEPESVDTEFLCHPPLLLPLSPSTQPLQKWLCLNQKRTIHDFIHSKPLEYGYARNLVQVLSSISLSHFFPHLTLLGYLQTERNECWNITSTSSPSSSLFV